MRDISLLMASLLTTGQTTVPELPEKLPEQPENTQQKLEQNQESSVVISPQIAPPDFIKSDNTLEVISENCDRNNCEVIKQSQISVDSSLQSPKTVITPTKSNLEASENNTSILIPQQSRLLPNQPLNQKYSLRTQKPEVEFDTDNQELQNQNIFANSENISGNQSLESENPMSQVTSVSELDDVNPTDWAFEALQSLASRHNCALVYPDGTFRGKRIINRYQFATGVDACLQQINELIVKNGASAIDEQDLIVLQRLQNEFRAELNQLEQRIISLEEKTGELEANRFSPTTRFFGQVTTSLQGSNTNEVDLFPRDGVPERTAQTNLTFANSMQITLATSFTGKDLLLTGLYAGNLGSSASS
ncbi:MAG: iron uptake porin, partial [Cyanobacteria bacterium J06632_19]